MSISTLYHNTISKKNTPKWAEACRAFGAALLEHPHIIKGLGVMGNLEDGYFPLGIEVHRDDVACALNRDDESVEACQKLASAINDDHMVEIARRMKNACMNYFEDDLKIVASAVLDLKDAEDLCPRCHEVFEEDDEGRCSSCGYDSEDPDDAADEGWLDDSEGKIGPGNRYTVKNHSQVRVLVGGKGDYGVDFGGRCGIIEGFDHNAVPMKVFVQFPDENGEYSGEQIHEFVYYDVAPVDAEEA